MLSSTKVSLVWLTLLSFSGHSWIWAQPQQQQQQRDGGSDPPFAFSSPLYEVSLPEGDYSSPAKALDVSLVPAGSDATFQLMPLVDSRSQSYFSIDSQTGEIRVMGELDRELMDMHYLKVTAVGGGSAPGRPFTATSTVHVRLSDANDNRPEFERSVYNASVHEVTPVGAVVAHVHASDPDKGPNGEVRYALRSAGAGASDSELFSMNAETGAISLRRQLNWEQKRRHVLKVFATDRAREAREALTSNATVVITVIDDNDNHPQFRRSRYEFHVSESVQWKDKPIVGTVSATDKDDGLNAKLKYSLIGGNNDQVFDIDPDDATLRVVRHLDREAQAKYTLIVRVQDMGSPPKSNTSQIVVSVDDVNDNAPKFPTAKYYQSVSENVPKDYAILQVQAFDPDQGHNSRISYSIPAGNDNLPFEVDRNTGWIKAKKTIDRELANSFHFSVVAMDAGNPPLSSSAQVTLTVLDTNDNDPQFERKEYRVSVKETVPLGSTILEVAATDGDEDADLRYEIVAGNTRNRFTISSHNGFGVITLAQPLNFGDESEYLIIVNAVDEGGRFGTCNVLITIVDANDHPPKFENTPYFADIFEDTPVGSTVLILYASDRDHGENARVSYRMKTESQYFSVDSASGTLTVARALDREHISTFILSVTAEDAGLPRLSDETEVEISILDVNDNAPRFARPVFTGSLRENAPVGTKVMRVTAVDDDERDNGKVTYRFEEPAASRAFAIDRVSGDVRSSGLLDREAVGRYELVVLATDGGTPENQARAAVHIDLLDVNDNPPVFVNDSMVFRLRENAPYGTKVGEILVSDPDLGENSEISFQLLNLTDAKYFYLGDFNQDGGISLFAKREFDYEMDPHEFALGIRAESPPLRTDASIAILLEDVNDNQPELADFHIIHNLQSDEYMFEELGRVPARDADESDRLTFSITYGNNADFLALDADTGELRLSPSLSSNVNIRAQIGLLVSDGQNEARSTLRLQINHVTEAMLRSSVTVRFANVTTATFLSPFLAFFEEALSMAVPCSKEEVVVFGIKASPLEAAVNVTFSVARGETNADLYVRPSHLKQRIYLQQEMIERVVGLRMFDFTDDICIREPCLNYETCVTEPKFGKEHHALAEGPVKFRSIDTLQTYTCSCPRGFTGMTTRYTCDTRVDLCYSSPCLNGGTCHSMESDFFCDCPAGFHGERCEATLRAGDCGAAERAACHAPSRCSSERDPKSEAGALFRWGCAGCSDNVFYDDFCRLTARSFSAGSYAAFPNLPQRVQLNVSLEFATQSPSGLLFFNGRLNDENDYVSLRLERSRLLFQFSTGEVTQMVTLSRDAGFSDGSFHRVEVSYEEERVVLSSGHCDVKLALEDQPFIPDALRCANDTVVQLSEKKACGSFLNQCYKFLDLSGPLLLGGFPSNRRESPAARHASFVGCIRNVYVNKKMVNLHEPVFNNGSLVGCPEKRHFCLSSPCKNGGTCVDGWGSYKCQCPELWTGKDCSIKSVKKYGLAATSRLSFQKKPVPVQFPWVNGLSFKTRLADTPLLLLHMEKDDLVSEIGIRAGKITYKIEGKEYALASSSVADNEWHNILVKWMADEVWLNLDYGQYERTHEHLSPLVANRVVKIEVGRGFQGCVQDVVVGEETDHRLTPLLQKALVDCARYEREGPGEGPGRDGGAECLLRDEDNTCLSFCSLNLCEGRSQCLDTQGGYQCQCASADQAGPYCARVSAEVCPRHWWGKPVCGPCDCNTQNGFNETCDALTGKCSCKDFHYPSASPTTGDVTCLACDCYSMGSLSSACDQVTGQCRCKEGVIGKRCDSCSHAFAELASTGCEVIYGNCPAEYARAVWWERTPFGEAAAVACPEASTGLVQRECTRQGWAPPRFSECAHAAFLPFAALNASEESWYLVKKLRGVLDKHEKNRFQFEKDNDIIYNATLAILEKEAGLRGFKLAHRKDREFLNNVVGLASWLLKVDRAPGSHDTVVRLALGLQSYGFTLLRTMSDTYTNPFEIVTDRLVFGLDKEDGGPQRAETRLRKRSLPPLLASTKVPPREMRNDKLADAEAVLAFPKYNNFMRDPEAWNDDSILASRLADGQEATTTALQYVIIGKAGLARLNVTSRDVMIPKLKSYHVHFFANLVTYSLLRPADQHSVVFRGRVSLVKNQLHCVQWSPKFRAWSSLDCETAYEAPYSTKHSVQVTCTCLREPLDADDLILADLADLADDSHAGVRPLLMTVMEERINKGHAFLSVHRAPKSGDLAFIGLASVAVLILLLTVGCLTFFNRSERNSVSIQRNIAASAFLFQITYLVTLLLNKSLVDDHFTLCKAMTLVLHFSSVSMFSWSFLSSFHIYRMLTELRDINHGSMSFYTALGFGIPAVVVILTIGVSGHNYGGQEVCWLAYSSTSIWGMIAPEIICIIFSIFFTLLNIRTVFSVKTDIEDFSLLRVLFFVNIGILPLLIGQHVTAVMLINEDEGGRGLFYAYLATAVVSAAYICIGFVICDRTLFTRPAGQSHNASSSSKHTLAAGDALTAAAAGGGGGSGGGYHMGTVQSGLSYRSHQQHQQQHHHHHEAGGGRQHRSMSHHFKDTLSVASTTSHSTYQTYQKGSPGQDTYMDNYISAAIQSESDSDLDKRSFDLASSHSSDEENEYLSRHAQLSVNDFPKY